MHDPRLARERTEFLERHKDAHYLVINSRTGETIGAVYYGPDWSLQDEVITAELKRFFTLVQVEMLRNEDPDAAS